MEEMNNEIIENGTTKIVEVIEDKVSFKDNVLAYTLAGTFLVGVGTIGYLGFKGTKALVNKFKHKRGVSDITEQVVEDINNNVENSDEGDESEQD